MVFYFKVVTTAKVQYQHQYRTRERHLGQFLRSALPFYIRTSESRVISTLLVDSDRAATVVTSFIEIAGCTLLVLAYLSLALLISPTLTLLAVPLFACTAILIRRHLKRGREFGREIGEDSQSFSQRVGDALRGIRLIKMRGLEATTADQLNSGAMSLAQDHIALARVRGKLEATTQPILIVGTFGVLYFAVEVLGMHLAELGMFMLVVTRTVPNLVQINNTRLNLYSALESHARMKRLGAEAAASRDVTSGDIPFQGLRSQIAFEDVHFSYTRDDQAVPALQGVSMAIPKGQTVALVGPSGAGKSTLVDLIARFYDPTQGRILVDDLPIEDYEITSLRRRIGFLTQDPIFFNDTIRANIEIGLDQPLSDAKLRDCLVKSQSAEFVDRLPYGVDSVIGERGLRLSGGQRQRLAIARALAQDPDVLLLDEPTSALDSISEAKIQKSLEALHGTISIVIIAHRLTTIRNADFIVVLDDGRIVDTGTHASLMGNQGPYRTLVEMQYL
jgi:ABC-type multidrug transport system fused ATPase/permease subunit